MPIDYRRINGPEESVPYELFVRKPQLTGKPSGGKSTEEFKFATHEAVREQRKIYLQTNVVSQAKGSAYIEIGRTKVIVSVFDPREIPNKTDYGLKGEVYCEFKYAPFSCTKRKLHQQNNEEKHFSSIMKKALESAICLHELPNFQVDIYAIVLEDDGSALSGSITAGGVALVEAGVPMYDLITSVTLGIYDGVIIAPPFLDDNGLRFTADSTSTKTSNGLLVISKLHTHKQICQFFQRGFISKKHVWDCMKAISTQCDNVVPVVQKCLVKNVLNNISSS